PVDVRILAASNVELLEAVSAGTFREDLYYRLNVVPIVIPPLRDRKEDIRILGESFLRKCNAKYGTDKILSEDAWKSLEKYRWPGNVRELENIIERVVIVPQGDVVDQGDIREMFSDISADEQFINPLNMTLKEEMNAYEKKIIESRMASCKTTKELARKLGIDKSTLTRKMNKLNIRKK
ncbi:MAG: sigma 54-interacting transcriptional regulator, partial [Anaerovoracaceae bacterium]|nr:sigma 54-interacting transcriptional regulator [Anaerovoracaceae bacterium]